MHRRPATFSFRTLLTAASLVLLVGTVAVLVSLSTWFTASNFRMLTQTITQQTLSRVEANVQQLLQRAVSQNQQVAQLLIDLPLAPTNFAAVSVSLANSLQAQPTLARVSLAIEPSGDFVQAERLHDGRIRLQEGIHSGPNTFTETRWEWRQGQRIRLPPTDLPPRDLRNQAGFREAINRRAPVWSLTYNWEEPGYPARWAIRNVMPMLGADGQLRAVVSTSLTLDELNRYLYDLDKQVPGFVTIVERTYTNGVLRVIGYPRNLQLVGLTFRRDEPSDHRLNADPVLTGYLKALGDQRPASDFAREFSVDGVSYLGSFQPLQRPTDPPWVIVMLMPVSEVAGGVEQNLHWAGFAAASFFVLATIIALWMSRRIAQPMLDLSADARAMSHLDFSSASRPLSSIREVRQLEQSLGEAKTSLRSFRKYVPADVVNTLLSSGNEAKLGGHAARLTMLFSDIVDFTRVAEDASPQPLVEQLGEYLAAVSRIIHEQRGVVDKYIGDGVMAFWGAPHSNPNHAADACIAACRIQECLDRLNTGWQAAGRPQFRTRIGLNTGDVIVGNIGSEDRMNYTVIGDPVNIAARLESLNRVYGTRILITDATRIAAGDVLLTRPVARVAVKGSQRGIVVHEVLGLAAEVDARTQLLAERTAAAFAALETSEVSVTRALYESLRGDFPGDGVAPAQLQFLVQIAPQIGRGDSDFIRRLEAK